MKIALLGTWHRRCGVSYFWRRAFRQLGHTVIGIGPLRPEEPWGTYGREPDITLSPQRWGSTECVYPYEALGALPWRPDLLFIADGGEGLRLTDIPADLPWVHLSSEGAAMDWSRGLTPHRYANIMCNRPGEGVIWLPNAYDAQEHWIRDEYLRDPTAPKAYDLIQAAAPRDARRAVWESVRQTAPDLRTYFGEAWGPIYTTLHQHARATFVCATLDFITTHVLEAMAMGCVVIADRTPSMCSLFTEGEHFIGYDPVPGAGGEGMPDPGWLIETARRLKRDGDGGMALRAHQRVAGVDSYQARAEQVLAEVFG